MGTFGSFIQGLDKGFERGILLNMCLMIVKPKSKSKSKSKLKVIMQRFGLMDLEADAIIIGTPYTTHPPITTTHPTLFRADEMEVSSPNQRS